MATVPPPINPALPQMLANAVASTPPATIAAPPPALATLAAGTTFQGTAETTPDPRVVLLSTAAGDVSLRTPAPLPDGAALTLEVVRATPAQISVRLIAIDGAPVQLTPQAPQASVSDSAEPAPEPAAAPSLPLAPGAAPPLAPGFAWWPGGAQAITALPVVSGFVVSAPAQPQSAQTPPAPVAALSAAPTAVPTLPALPTGADVALRVVSIALPQPGAETPPQPGVIGTTPQIPTVPTAPTPNAAIPPAAAGPTPAPNAIVQPTAVGAPAVQPASVPVPTITIADLAPNAPQVASPATTPGLVLPQPSGWPAAAPTPPSAVQPLAPLATVTAPVIATANTVPTIQIGEAAVQLNVRANLPVGTMVTVELRAIQPPLTPLTAVPQPTPAVMPLSLAQPSWPSLTESLALLQRSDPVAAQWLANTIPDGGPRTAAAVISFMQAMRTGDARQWPGDATLQALERISPRGAHLASQLAGEVADLSRQVRDVGAEWRAFPIPWQSEGRIARIRMVVRETDPEAEAEKRKKGGGGVRFLLDLDLSRLGPMQLDGMFQKSARQLDLMIRTKAALPDALRQALSGIFATSNAAMNLVGTLSFQVVRTFPDPAAPNPKADKSGLWV